MTLCGITQYNRLHLHNALWKGRSPITGYVNRKWTQMFDIAGYVSHPMWCATLVCPFQKQESSLVRRIYFVTYSCYNSEDNHHTWLQLIDTRVWLCMVANHMNLLLHTCFRECVLAHKGIRFVEQTRRGLPWDMHIWRRNRNANCTAMPRARLPLKLGVAWMF